MQTQRLLQSRENPWINGLRLALLNGAVAVFCVASFVGTLFAVGLVSNWRMAARGGDPSADVPFPYPLLLLLYAMLFLAAWARFGRRLIGTRRERLQTALVGASPVFGLSLLGYAGVVWMLVLGDFNANTMLDASVWIYGMISTLILFAGLTCVGVIVGWMVNGQPK